MPLFTANMHNSEPGNYNFGYINKSEYIGEIGYTKVDTNPGFWQFNSSGYAVASETFMSTNFRAIADTGTTLLYLPDAICDAYYSSFGGSLSADYGAYVFPCNATVPNFTFGIGDYRGVIAGSYINEGRIDSVYCYGGIQSNDGIGISIFGAVALTAQFVVFDVGNTRIGFANKPAGASPNSLGLAGK